MPPTAAYLSKKFAILLKKFNKLPQIPSDKSALFVTHFIALIGVFTGIGTNVGFFCNSEKKGPGGAVGSWSLAWVLSRLGGLQGAEQGQSGLVVPSLLFLRSGKIL